MAATSGLSSRTLGTLPFPWPQTDVSFNSEQVVETAEHILAIPGWVPADRVIQVVHELLEQVDDADAVMEVIENPHLTIDATREDTESQAARLALLAARLINSHKLHLYGLSGSTTD